MLVVQIVTGVVLAMTTPRMSTSPSTVGQARRELRLAVARAFQQRLMFFLAAISMACITAPQGAREVL
jgi:hypothetical protein